MFLEENHTKNLSLIVRCANDIKIYDYLSLLRLKLIHRIGSMSNCPKLA